MNPRERRFVLWSIWYMAIYVLVFLICVLLHWLTDNEWWILILLPFHFVCMIQNFAVLGLTLCDLYWRPFPKLYWKWIWLVLIVYTGGIGWFIYLFRHALKPRPELANA